MKKNQVIIASGSSTKTVKMLPVSVKKIASRCDDQAERDRQDAKAQLRAADDVVLLGWDLARVPALAAALALPGLAVAQVALLAALAGDRDRRAAQDRAGLLAAQALALAPCGGAAAVATGHGASAHVHG